MKLKHKYYSYQCKSRVDYRNIWRYSNMLKSSSHDVNNNSNIHKQTSQSSNEAKNMDRNDDDITVNGYKYSKTNQTTTVTSTWDPYMAPKLDFDECYYDVLEANSSYDTKELKKAYYKVVYKYHPDTKETEEEKELSNKQMMVSNCSYQQTTSLLSPTRLCF